MNEKGRVEDEQGTRAEAATNKGPRVHGQSEGRNAAQRNVRFCIDGHAPHAVVQRRRHRPHVERARRRGEFRVVEKLFPKRVFARRRRRMVPAASKQNASTPGGVGLVTG